MPSGSRFANPQAGITGGELSFAGHRLWSRLASGRLDGLRFARGMRIGPAVVDFACPDARLAIRVDGRADLAQLNAGTVQDRHLEQEGWRVAHYSEGQVLEDLEWVLGDIRFAADVQLAAPAAGTATPQVSK